ncbi:MAG: NYN domain-containing protein [Deltaproteobacteria bacterium]|nr:NYN domain-containing protein [Deltaproteobacteria bacterium]
MRGSGNRPPDFLGEVVVRTYVYIDGFNFYYGAVKDTRYKWLDFKKLFSMTLAQHNQILKIKYFTALVNPTETDPDKQLRQRSFIRALETYLPEIEVHYGHFLTTELNVQLVEPIQNIYSSSGVKLDDIYTVQATKPEEKGSDVNLAVHLLNDAWLNLYECAVIVSNDSDLTEAMMLTKSKGKLIGLINPTRRPTSVVLKRHADFVKPIFERALAKSQLPNPIPGTAIHKPASW